MGKVTIKWRKAMESVWTKPRDHSKCGLPKNRPQDVWKNIEKRGADECWPWMAALSNGGYGVFRIEGRYYKAHRVVYSLSHPTFELSAPRSNYEKGFVLHRCDNPRCCNPKHLYLGDIFDNMKDKVARGRCGRTGPRKRRNGT